MKSKRNLLHRILEQRSRLVTYLVGDFYRMSLKAILMPSDDFYLRISTLYICTYMRLTFVSRVNPSPVAQLLYRELISRRDVNAWIPPLIIFPPPLPPFDTTPVFFLLSFMKYFYYFYLLMCEMFMKFGINSQQLV